VRGVTNLPNIEYGITSDGFFDMERLPKKAVIVGSGYIAVEIGAILHSLGTHVTLLTRSQTLLRYVHSNNTPH
jgi:thioredoxin reductase